MPHSTTLDQVLSHLPILCGANAPVFHLLANIYH